MTKRDGLIPHCPLSDMFTLAYTLQLIKAACLCVYVCVLAVHKPTRLTHRLQVNRTRFPSGIRSIADKLHAKGLKLGVVRPLAMSAYLH